MYFCYATWHCPINRPPGPAAPRILRAEGKPFHWALVWSLHPEPSIFSAPVYRSIWAVRSGAVCLSKTPFPHFNTSLSLSLSSQLCHLSIAGDALALVELSKDSSSRPLRFLDRFVLDLKCSAYSVGDWFNCGFFLYFGDFFWLLLGAIASIAVFGMVGSLKLWLCSFRSHSFDSFDYQLVRFSHPN